MMDQVRGRFGKKQQIRLSDCFKESRDMNEVITIFLATLELVKVQEILVQQEENFGEIYLVRSQDESNS
ncbi:Segregation and condensation protein A [Chlamydia trachomatis]|nr:Segregation and condensation protein A [Chlamydia trachomatis]